MTLLPKGIFSDIPSLDYDAQYYKCTLQCVIGSRVQKVGFVADVVSRYPVISVDTYRSVRQMVESEYGGISYTIKLVHSL